MSRADLLDSYLQQVAAKPWVWAECDCTMVIADWIRLIHGRDPAKRFRGKYHDPETIRALIRRHGGFMPMVGTALDKFGLQRTQEPRTGDVGIVQAPMDLGQRTPVIDAVFAIRTGDFWTARALRGIVGYRFPLIAAWRV